MTAAAPVLEVSNLRVVFHGRGEPVVAVRDVSLSVSPGEIVAVVGESGSGKSAMALSIAGLVPENATVTGRWDAGGNPSGSAHDRFGVVFQDPLGALNPMYTLGWQVIERMLVAGVGRDERRRRGMDLLRQVGFSDPERVYGLYPHQVSGGMRQRAMIAIALSGDPAVIIADEPTTALDVSVQKQVLDLLRHLVETRNLAMILITHDLAVVADVADRVVVMYAGSMVEHGPTRAVLDDPRHPYTRALLGCSLTLASPRKTFIPEIAGTVPQLGERLHGCPFLSRCGIAETLCRDVAPDPADAARERGVMCHFATGADAHA